jgi:hypothetical protein
MKKIAICLMAICLSLTFLPLQSIAAGTTESTSLVVTKPVETSESEEAKALLKRLEEIKTMDKSTMKPAEKKNLKMEVRATKSHLREIGGGLYISGGALIIILLLIIIL